jgi:hypothetical protein
MEDKRQIVNESNKLKTPNGELTWWELKHQAVILPAHSWAEIKKFIINICKESEICKDNVSSWDRAVSDIDSWLKEN